MEGPRAAVTSFHPPVSAQKAKNRAASQPEPPTAVHPSLTSMQIPQRVLFLSFLVFFFFFWPSIMETIFCWLPIQWPSLAAAEIALTFRANSTFSK